MITFLSTQKMAFQGNDETIASDIQGNFKELEKAAATLDENFKKFINPFFYRLKIQYRFKNN